MALTFLESDFPAGDTLTYKPAFGSGAYVLVTDGGATWRSTNYGKNWLLLGSRLPAGLYLITYSQNFVAININTGDCYRLVADSWVQGQSVDLPFNSSSVLYSVHGTTYFIGGDPDTGYNLLFSSTNDGASWTILPFADGANTVLKAYATNGTNQHVLVGFDTSYFSLDGISWQNESIPAGAYNTVSWANGLFIAGSSAAKQTFTSTNGTSWVSGPSIFSNYSASTRKTFCFGGQYGETSGVVSGNGTDPFVDDIYPAYPNVPTDIASSPVNFVAYNRTAGDVHSIWYTEPVPSVSFGLTWFFAP